MRIDENDLPHFRVACQTQKGVERGAQGFDGVLEVRGGAGCRLRDIRLNCFEYGGKESLLVFEMMIQGAAADARFL